MVGIPLGEPMHRKLAQLNRGAVALDPVLSSRLASSEDERKCNVKAKSYIYLRLKKTQCANLSTKYPVICGSLVVLGGFQETRT